MLISPSTLIGVGLGIADDAADNARKVKQLEERVRELEYPLSKTTADLPSGSLFYDVLLAVLIVGLFPPTIIIILPLSIVLVCVWIKLKLAKLVKRGRAKYKQKHSNKPTSPAQT